MRTADNGIQVDNTHVTVGMPAAGIFGLDDPQPGGTVGFSVDRGVPVHEGTWVLHIGKRELEKKVDTGHK